MAIEVFNHLIRLINRKKSARLPATCGAAKLPPAADFAGPFTSP
jgi:hypothetical protein